MNKTFHPRTGDRFLTASRETAGACSPAFSRPACGRRVLRPFLLSLALVIVSYFGIDGPVFVTNGPTPSLANPYAGLEKRFDRALANTELVIVNTDALSGRDAIEAYVSARLNERGIFLSAGWASFMDRASDPAHGARALWRQFLGGRYGEGPLGYLQTTAVCVVTTGTEARALAARTGLPEAFWGRLVVVHELQHCVDADRGNLAEPGTMVTPMSDDGRWTSPETPDRLRISGRELYADAAAVLFLMREGAALDAIAQFARFRAQPVLAALAQRQTPAWPHFTAPMLTTMMHDVRVGQIQPGRLSDDDIHDLAMRYRDRALIAAADISVTTLRKAMNDAAAGPASILRQAGAPPGWVALADQELGLNASRVSGDAHFHAQ